MTNVEHQVQASKAKKHYHVYYPIVGYVESFATEAEARNYIEEDKKETLYQYDEEMRHLHSTDWDDVIIEHFICDDRHGAVVFDGYDQYYLQEEAYAENDATAECGYSFFAKAKSRDSLDECLVKWIVINPDEEVEYNSCNWDEYVIIHT